MNFETDIFVYRPDLETTIFASLPPESLNYSAINLFSHKLCTLTIAKITTSSGTEITLKTSLKQLRALTMCSAFTPDSRYNNSIINLMGKCMCLVRLKSNRIYFAGTKRLFNLSAE